MIVEYCDICGRELDKRHNDQVNLDFNAYGCTGFRLVIDKEDHEKELQLCLDCANSVVTAIEVLKHEEEENRREHFEIAGIPLSDSD